MKVATTIQVTSEEDQEIARLKKILGLPTKKAVVMEGIRSLRQILRDQQRRRRLQEASAVIQSDSRQTNREWAPHSTAIRIRSQ